MWTNHYQARRKPSQFTCAVLDLDNMRSPNTPQDSELGKGNNNFETQAQ